jgi:excisionase family DNA binding protein
MYNGIMETNTDQLLTTKQVGEVLGLSQRRIVELINEGRLLATKVSHIWLIRRKDLDNIKPALRPVGRPKLKSEDE